MSIAEYFKGLPMSDLIAGPLVATCDAQRKLAAAAYEYMVKVGFKEGDATKDPNLIKFTLERPVEILGKIETNKLEVQAPFLGLVPIPVLLVDTINVDFQMEVTSTTSSTTDKKAEVSSDIDSKSFFSPVKVEMHGKVSTSKENTRSTNQTAKYQVHVSASQQPPSEGLSRLMDILASCTAPLPIDNK